MKKKLSEPNEIIDTLKNLNNQKVEFTNFNHGHITNPLQLIQARFPSLLITRGGNDPNGQFDLRIRGLKSFDVTEPLIVIDGIPGLSIEGIHSNDIASVEVFKDGAAIAKYGIRGSNGVISIKTKRGEQGKTSVQYQGYMAIEKIAKTPDLLDAKGYLTRHGNDLGSSTTWWDEISQSATNQTHHISLSRSSEKNSYYASLNYDNVSGVLRNTGFDRFNGRLSFEQKALNDRISISGNLGHTHKESSYITPLAVEMANSYNPTAPVYSEDEEFIQYGGYFQQPHFYYTFNPVALIEQLDYDDIYQQTNVNIQSTLRIFKGISASIQYGQQAESWEMNSYVPINSYYGDHNKGYAARRFFKRSNQYTRTSLDFEQSIGDFEFNGSLAYQYQNFEQTSLGARGGNFITDVFSYHNLSASNDFPNGSGSISSSKSIHEISAYNGSLNISYKNKYYLSTAVSREGSSRLGKNNKWGLFYGINAGAQIQKNIQIRAGFSKTGNLPSQDNISQAIYAFDSWPGFYYNGNFQETTRKIQNANPNLQWEETTEWNLGVDFSLLKGKLNGSFDLYNYQANELIRRMDVPIPPNAAPHTYMNVGKITGGGFELALNYQAANRQGFKWNIGLLHARYFKTILKDYGFEADQNDLYIGILGGRCAFPVYRLREGHTVGQIWGHQFHASGYVNDDGRWNFIDRNRDGYFSHEDYINVGNGMPKSSLGITNVMEFGNFKIDMLLRGVFGHDVINHIKSFHSSPGSISWGSINILKDPDYELSGLWDNPDFSERDVEKASYLRLGYLTFSYDIKPKQFKPFESVNIFVTTQNLFTITAYSGLDPELRMEDRHDFNNSFPAGFSDIGNPLIPGMDRVESYPASRIFLVGVKVSL